MKNEWTPLLLPVHVMFRTTHASQSFHMLDAALEHTVAVDTETRRATYPLSHHSDHMTVHVPRGVCYMLQSQGHMSHHPDLCTGTTPLVGLHWSYHSPTVCLQPGPCTVTLPLGVNHWSDHLPTVCPVCTWIATQPCFTATHDKCYRVYNYIFYLSSPPTVRFIQRIRRKQCRYNVDPTDRRHYCR